MVSKKRLQKFGQKMLFTALALAMGMGLSLVCVSQVPTSVEASSGTVEMWWPSEGAHLSGSVPFKGLLKDTSVENYSMFWKVDQGNLVSMSSSYNDYPHKEAQVDLAGWKWKGNEPYTITFVAQDGNGQVLGQKSVNVYVNYDYNAPAKPVATTPPPVASSTPSPVASILNPLLAKKLFVDTDTNAKRQADAWASTRPADAQVMKKLSLQPVATWLGNWNVDVKASVKGVVDRAANQNQMPVLVAYNIPVRDCGSYSAGGANSPTEYLKWIRAFKDGIGTRSAVVILEPDAVAGMDCLSDAMKNDRLKMIQDAISIFKENKNTAVYVDAGNAHWIGADVMADRLKKAGIDKADGFALNVSNFYTNSENITYGEQLSKLLNSKHFVIDTSRNGNGSNGQWCNPEGRKIGATPTTSTGNSLVDAFLWIKTPGESDGNCNGGPSAGTWWPEYALKLGQ
jgi:endoglucanase